MAAPLSRPDIIAREPSVSLTSPAAPKKAISTLGWMWQGVTHVAGAVGSKAGAIGGAIGGSVVAFSAFRNLTSQDEANKKLLIELTGSDQCSQAIIAGAPLLTKILRKVLNEKIPEFITRDETAFQKFITSALLTAATNLIKEVRKPFIEGAPLPSSPNVLIDIVIWFTRLNTAHGSELQKKINSIVHRLVDEEERNKELFELFQPIADKLLLVAFPDGNLGLRTRSGANKIVLSIIKGQLPSLLATTYMNYIGARKDIRVEHEKTVKELSAVLYDKEADRTRILAGTPDPEAAARVRAMFERDEAEKLWADSGVTEEVTQINHGTIKIASKITNLVKGFFRDTSAKELSEKLSFSSFIGDSGALTSWLSIQVKSLAESDNPVVNGFWANIQDFVAKGLFTVVCNIAEDIAKNEHDPIQAGEHRESAIVSRLLVQLSKTFEAHGKPESFEALSKELLGLVQSGFGDHRDPLYAFPISLDMKEALWNWIRKDLLPNKVFSLIRESYGQQERKILADEIDSICKHPVGQHAGITNACETLGKFIGEFTSSHLAAEGEALAKLVWELPAVQEILVTLNPVQKQQITVFLKDIIKEMGESQDPHIKNLFKEVGEYSQDLLLNLFGRLSKKINLVEQRDPKFFIKTTTHVLTALGAHFNLINRVTRNYGKSNAYSLKDKQLLEGFEGNLHIGVPKDPARPDQDKEKIEMDGFYIPFMKKVVDLADMTTAKDFALPVPIVDWLKTNIGPKVLRGVVENLLSRHTINSLMLKILEPMENAVDDLAARDEAQLLEEAARDPADIRNLNQACGEAVKALVKMLPLTITKLFFKLESVQNLSAEVLGRCIRDKLGTTTVLETLNTLLGSTLSNPLAVNPAPVTEVEKNRVETELKKISVRCASKKIDLITRTFFSSTWSRFQAAFDMLVEKYLGVPGKRVKDVLDRICSFIFFTVIGSIVGFVWQNSLYLLCQLIIKFWLTSVVGGVLESLHMKVHKSAVFNTLDNLIGDLMQGAAVPTPAPAPQPAPAVGPILAAPAPVPEIVIIPVPDAAPAAPVIPLARIAQPVGDFDWL